MLAQHAELTLTGLYNVLAKVGAGGTAQLAAKERALYDKGLIGVLKSLHDDLDAAVLDAYGWRDNPTDEQLLERLVALNFERGAEEAQGRMRWLRPDFQAPKSAQAVMAGIGVSRAPICVGHEAHGTPQSPPAPWPNTLPEQIAALDAALGPTPQSPDELAARFAGKGRWKTNLSELLATLAALGRARQLEDGRWMG